MARYLEGRVGEGIVSMDVFDMPAAGALLAVLLSQGACERELGRLPRLAEPDRVVFWLLCASSGSCECVLSPFSESDRASTASLSVLSKSAWSTLPQS